MVWKLQPLRKSSALHDAQRESADPRLESGEPAGSSAAKEAWTVDELSAELLELRELLNQLAADIDAVSENGVGLLEREEDAPVSKPDDRLAEDQLLCHQCSRLGAKHEPGWTLRLCGDDELHVLCAECDNRYISRDRLWPPSSRR